MLLSEFSSLTKIYPGLAQLSQKQATGELILRSVDYQWHLYFFLGRIIYAYGQKHRVRQWWRAIKQHCPAIASQQKLISTAMKGNELWEHQQLSQAIAAGEISLAQAKAVIQSSAQEVFVEIANYPLPCKSVWQTYKAPTSQIALLEVDQLNAYGQSIAKEWQEMGLGQINLNLGLIWRNANSLPQTSPENSALLSKWLTGKHTLWDLAVALRTSITKAARFLLPLVKQGKIEFQEIPDLIAPVAPTPILPQSSASSRGLIACIDDSPVISHRLEIILRPAGYGLLRIQDPLREMSILVKQKPELIFLDLIMPDTSGYSLCSFLRKTPVFAKTPIVILTSQDGIFDRTRAKLVGASDFLGKPPEAQKVLQVIAKYLPVNSSRVISDESMPNWHNSLVFAD